MGTADGRRDACALPVVIFFLLVQRRIAFGLTAGAVRADGAIQLVHLSKVYGGRRGPRPQPRVAEGEFVVLVGPSGCGKTTALRMIAGLEEITDGEIRIGGKVVNDLPPRDRDIAMVFQNYALYPHKTVYENLAFGLRMRKVPKDEQKRRVEEIARILGLDDMLKRRPAQLSGGQRQRVAMGRAIVREPKAFLMDEPLSNLDAKLRVQMRAEIARIQLALRVTTVYVTHDQVEAMTMGHRVAVMRDGVLQQVDTPQRLYDAPDEPLRRELCRVAADESLRGDRSSTTTERLSAGSAT